MNYLKTSCKVLIFLLLVSCAPNIQWTQATITERLLPFPTGYYDHVVYIDNQVVGFTFNSGLRPEEQIAFAYEGDKETTPFNPEQDLKCTKYSYFEVVSILPDGRLGLLKECRDNSASTIFNSTNRFIYAYDWHSQELDRLVDGKLTQGSNPKFYTWNPDMTMGVQETGPGYPGTIYWIEPNGISPMDIEIKGRGLTWNLKDYLEDKTNTGAARHPAWSPDGKTIAFFATTYGIKEEALPKYNVSYDLYFMDPFTLIPKQELLNIADASYKIVWSPNNQHLLFRGCFGSKCGLWRYTISIKTLTLVKEGEFADYIWITNEKIVVTKNTDLPYKDNQIWEYSILE